METDSILWINKQFTNVHFGDKRLNKRIKIITNNMIKKPAKSINAQSETWGESKGAYRFFDNPKVNVQNIIKPHIDNVVYESNFLKRILVIQDTCYVGYGHHTSVNGLGHIGKKDTSGVIIHNSIAVNPDTKYPEIIGIIDFATHNRLKKVDDSWKETELWREASNRISINTKKTQVIEVMDREGAAYETMKNCLNCKHDFLVRSKEGKKVRSPFKKKLVDTALKIPIAGKIQVEVPKKKGQIKRSANLEIKYMPIEIPGPSGNREKTIKCNLVQAVEVNAPDKQEPLSWYLLTSVNVESFEEAKKVIEWYKYRWIIEEHHKAIKTGCNAEGKQLKEAFRIENFLAVAAVIGIRLVQLRGIARIIPDAKAIDHFDELEIKLLLKKNDESIKKLTVREFYINVAKLGGFLARKSDGNPGWQTLWDGFQQLYWKVEGAKEMLRMMKTYG
jgi:hypothetical protein